MGIDRGEPSRGVYALNVLVGHHGIFSLTPIWLLSVCGHGLVDVAARRPAAALAGRRGWRPFRWPASCSISCQPLINRNYGGMTSGLRWVFWLAPLWLLAMLPAGRRPGPRRWTRGLALALLALSVLSASYPTWNPWTHPWLMNWMPYLGVV